MNKSFILASIIMILTMISCTAVYAIDNGIHTKTYKIKNYNLQKEIDSNNKAIENINNSIKYHGSDAFVEKIAREKLGYVMNDEIIFQQK